MAILPIHTLLFFTIVSVALGIPHLPDPHHHHIQRAKPHSLEKRYQGSFTFYDVGMGACGRVNSANEWVVALNAPQFDASQSCFKTITLTAMGKTRTATIVDRCAGCGFGSVDFSRGLFAEFAPESAGRISGTWEFGSGEPEKPTTTEKPTPTPTPTKEPEPTTTRTPTKEPEVTPSETPSTIKTPSASSVSPSSDVASPTSGESAAVSSPSPSQAAGAAAQQQQSTFGQIEQAFLGMSGLIASGARA